MALKCAPKKLKSVCCAPQGVVYVDCVWDLTTSSLVCVAPSARAAEEGHRGVPIGDCTAAGAYHLVTEYCLP